VANYISNQLNMKNQLKLSYVFNLINFLENKAYKSDKKLNENKPYKHDK